MRTWEDIVRDKMEACVDALPESAFAEFQARRDAGVPAVAGSSGSSVMAGQTGHLPAAKRFPLVWVLVPAVAAGLAAVLLLRRPGDPEGEIQLIRQPAPPVAVVSDSMDVAAPVAAEPLIARASMPSVVRHPAMKTDNPVAQGVLVKETREEPPTGETVTIESGETDIPDQQGERITESTTVTATSPFIQQDTPSGPVKMKVAPAAGLVAGGGLLAALVSPVLATESSVNVGQVVEWDGPISINPADDLVGQGKHFMPVKAGLSTRFAVTDRLYLTTGLEYSRYSSLFEFAKGGEKRQLAHYLGIPLRLDWTMASNRWFNVYLGGGLAGDYCLTATLGGEKIAKDGFSLSLLGAGGLQWNMNDRFGLYVEPTLSWTFPSESRVLETWRTERPLMFSVAGGIRYTLGK